MQERDGDFMATSSEQLGSLSIARRKPRSSCEACRKAKIGCDSAITKGGTCSNCLRRNHICIVKGQENRKRKTAGSRAGTAPSSESVSLRSFRSRIATASSPPSGLEQQAACRYQSDVLHDMLWDVFTQIFEKRVEVLMSSGSFPFQDPFQMPQSKPHISALVVKLDKRARCMSDRNKPPAARTAVSQNQDEELIDQAFISAIRAYSMRWLKVSNSSRLTTEAGLNEQESEHASNNIWHQARRKIQSAMSIPSYRSILALHVFGLTPLPSDHHDEQIRDLCTEIGLNHQNRLWQEPNQIRPSQRLIDSASDFASEGLSDQSYELESASLQQMLYWFSVTRDTARSLSRSCPSVIIPGRTGEVEVWNFIEKKESYFEDNYGFLRYFDEPMTDNIADPILEYASANCKMVWGAVVQAQNAVKLRQLLLLEPTISNAFKRITRFNEIFKLLLSRCGRDIFLLNEQCQLSYFIITLHFNLSILILLDMIPSSLQSDHTRVEHTNLRKASCLAVVNTITLALQVTTGSSTPQDTSLTACPSKSILLFDPSPESLVLTIQLTAASLLTLRRQDDISARALDAMFPVLLRSLTQLTGTAQIRPAEIAALESEFKDTRNGIPVRGCENNMQSIQRPDIPLQTIDEPLDTDSLGYGLFFPLCIAGDEQGPPLAPLLTTTPVPKSPSSFNYDASMFDFAFEDFFLA